MILSSLSYQDLQAHAKSLGIENVRIKKDDLIAAIVEAESKKGVQSRAAGFEKKDDAGEVKSSSLKDDLAMHPKFAKFKPAGEN